MLMTSPHPHTCLLYLFASPDSYLLPRRFPYSSEYTPNNYPANFPNLAAAAAGAAGNATTNSSSSNGSSSSNNNSGGGSGSGGGGSGGGGGGGGGGDWSSGYDNNVDSTTSPFEPKSDFNALGTGGGGGGGRASNGGRETGDQTTISISTGEGGGGRGHEIIECAATHMI